MGRNRAIGSPYVIQTYIPPSFIIGFVGAGELTTSSTVDLYLVDNINLVTPVSVFLDPNAVDGDQVTIQDISETAASCPIVIAPSPGQSIIGQSGSVSISTNGGGILLTYSATASGWAMAFFSTGIVPVEGDYTIPAGQALGSVMALSSAPNTVVAAQATSQTTKAFGVLSAYVGSAVPPNEGVIVSQGSVTLTSWNLDGVTGQLLTPGTTYYLSALSPGALTATAPSGLGTFVQVVGTASSTTTLVVNVQQNPAGTNVVTNSIDTPASPTTLVIGPTNATSITIGRSGVPVTAPGGVVAPTLDSSAGLAIGGTSATSITVGRSGIPVTATGGVVAPTLDSTAGLTIGGTSATSITVGRSGIPATFGGGVQTATLDTATSGQFLTVGGTNAEYIVLGAATTYVRIAASLEVVGGSAATIGGIGAGPSGTAQVGWTPIETSDGIKSWLPYWR